MTISTLPDTQDPKLAVVSLLGEKLIKARCQEQLTHEELGRAVRTAKRCGASVDSISEASGLRPATVKDFIHSEDRDENLAVLAGLG